MANLTVKFLCLIMAALALSNPVASWAASPEDTVHSVPCTTRVSPPIDQVKPASSLTGAESVSLLYLLPIPLAASDSATTGFVVPLSGETIERMDADELQIRISATEKLIADLTSQMPPALARQVTDCTE